MGRFLHTPLMYQINRMYVQYLTKYVYSQLCFGPGQGLEYYLGKQTILTIEFDHKSFCVSSWRLQKFYGYLYTNGCASIT